MARIKFAPVVIPQISSWVDAGFSTREIAEKIGCTLGTLRVRCSQLGISLRHDGRDKHTYTTNVGDRPQASERQARGEAMQAIKILEGRENLLVLTNLGVCSGRASTSSNRQGNLQCKNWYSISRTVSDNGASRQNG